MNENENGFDESALKYLREAFGEPKSGKKKKKKKSKKSSSKVKLIDMKSKKKKCTKKGAFNKLFGTMNTLYTKVYVNRKKYDLSKKNAMKLIRDLILG